MGAQNLSSNDATSPQVTQPLFKSLNFSWSHNKPLLKSLSLLSTKTSIDQHQINLNIQWDKMVHDAICNCAQCNGMQHTMECMVAKWRLMIEARKSEIGGSSSNGKVLDLNHNDRHNLHHHVLAHVNECC